MAAILISFIFMLLINFFPAIAMPGNESNNTDGLQLQTYIVYVQKSKQPKKKIDSDSWYQSFLPGTISNRQSRMVYCFKNVVSGFAARLTAEEAKAMGMKKKKRGFISAHVEKKLQMHTTHTPNLLGLHLNSGLWKDSNLGKGVIIGVLDSGITPGHPSFNDEGMPPPPAKWKGKCELKGVVACNNKLIGARNLLYGDDDDEGEPPIDYEGHGTHTASTAAGNFVSGANLFGQAHGTAAGIAPLAHLAIYKVFDHSSDAKHIPESVFISAIETAVEDGVDVLSLSFGIDFSDFFANSIAIATFSATRRGVFVSASAGNFGPNSYSLVNDAPWMLTVGASTIDRSIVASAQLGNHAAAYDGETLFQPKDFPSKQLPLVYAGARNLRDAFCSPETLKTIDINGKIVLCQIGGATGTVDKGMDVKDAGGAAMILMNDRDSGNITLPEFHVLPAMHVSYLVGESIKAYIDSTSSSSSSPTAAMVFKGTVISKNFAPEVAAFSSRGPSRASPGILKPDIIGPGVNILAAWPASIEYNTNTEFIFNILSGTSMSCPHLSGVATLLKSAHPDWSPAAIKSAIMTTADAATLEGNNDQTLHLAADPFAVGAGHVNPSKANDPGLIYDIQPQDYIPYLCGLNYTDEQVESIVNDEVQCSKVPSIAEAELNYPSFSIKLGTNNPQTYHRTVTNVGETNSSYTHQIINPEGVEITVQPDEIYFTEKNQKATYTVTFTRTRKTDAAAAQAYLSWVSAHHTVKSPIAIIFE